MKKLFFGLIVLSLLVMGCTQSTPQATAQPSGSIQATATPSGTVQATPSATGTVSSQPTGSIEATPTVGGSVKEIRIVAKQFTFEPSTITVNKGDAVRLVVTTADITHGLNIPGYGINENIQPGKETTIEFTADKVGEFKFFCSVPCGGGHREMTGKLVVNG